MRLAGVLAWVLMAAAPLEAQRAEQRFAGRQDTTTTHGPDWSAARIAKWSTLLVSTGAVAYGFSQNRLADREYEEMERACESAPESCATTSSGQYVDSALEQRYQAVLRRDDRARLALLLGQVGIAASVLLFILDLPENTTPEDIPYDPRPLRIGLAPHGIGVALQLALP